MDTAVVFGRACGAASTTFPGEKTPETHTKKPTPKTKKTYKTHKAGLRAPPLQPLVTKKYQREPKTAQTSQRHPKGHHENAKETPNDPKGCPKSAGGLPKSTKK